MPRTITGNDAGVVTLKRNPYQLAFLENLKARHSDGSRLYQRLSLFSGRRGGKTKIGAIGLSQEAGKPMPDQNGRVDNAVFWACAPTYPDLHDYVLPALRESLPTSWIEDWSEQNYEFKLINGSLIQCRSLDDPERGRGPGLRGCWLDEARKIQKRAWDTLRPALTEHRGFGLFTTSPNGFDWCYHTLWLPAQRLKPGYWAAKYKTIENPIIPKEEIDEARDTLDPQFFRQEYEADFVHFTGSIYGSLLEPCILRTDEEIRAVVPEWPNFDRSRPSICALDPGADHPFAATHLIKTEKGLVCIGEHLHQHRPLADHVLNIRQMLLGYQPKFIYDRTAIQTAIELRQHGIKAFPSESDQIAGIHRVQSWLKSRQLFFIEPLVPETIGQMRNLHWKENVAKSGELRREQQFKAEDDLADCVRYAVMSWPELPEAPILSTLRDLSQLDDYARWAVERMRRIEAAAATPYEELPLVAMEGAYHPLGDFYGHETLEDDIPDVAA